VVDRVVPRDVCSDSGLSAEPENVCCAHTAATVLLSLEIRYNCGLGSILAVHWLRYCEEAEHRTWTPTGINSKVTADYYIDTPVTMRLKKARASHSLISRTWYYCVASTLAAKQPHPTPLVQRLTLPSGVPLQV
jgi:hypothetical protein